MMDDVSVEFEGFWQEAFGSLMNGGYSVHQGPVEARRKDPLRTNLENHKGLDRLRLGHVWQGRGR